MFLKRVCSALLALAVLLGLGAFALHAARERAFSLPAGQWINDAVTGRLRQSDLLEGLAPEVLRLGGAKEQNGIFITESGLIEDIPAGKEAVINANVAGIAACIAGANTPASVMLIPTAAAVKQSELPANADLYNQKALILSVYSNLAGVAGAADAYAELFGAREETIFCRPSSQLTGLGGYYVYRALAARLGLAAHRLDEFEIENLESDFIGELVERSGYRRVQPDLLSLYRYTRASRVGTVTCWREGVPYTYTTLYPAHLEALGRPSDVLLGGACERLDIAYSAHRGNSLLLFADETAQAYVPFLATHYRRLTVIDPRIASRETLAAVDPADYDRMVFACSVRTFSQEEIFARFAA
jgi:hypothetical protein